MWQHLRDVASDAAEADPLVAAMVERFVLLPNSFEEALGVMLAARLACPEMDRDKLQSAFIETLAGNMDVTSRAVRDLEAHVARNPTCSEALTPFLFFKGFQGLQAYRLSHAQWRDGRRWLALAIQSRISEVFGMDVHPAAVIGSGIFIDHGTSLVVGETAVVGDDVSILHEVTLGGTGKESGDRHPKIGDGVLIGAGAKVLGNVQVGEGAKIGAGSVVLHPVPPHTTVAGVPARVVGICRSPTPALEMDHSLPRARPALDAAS
jgi:serine O-acetyltransferase